MHRSSQLTGKAKRRVCRFGRREAQRLVSTTSDEVVRQDCLVLYAARSKAGVIDDLGRVVEGRID
jgi:hypothetical protein